MLFLGILGFVFGVLVVLFLGLIIFDALVTPDITEEDVLNALSHSVWKTGMEITKEIYKVKQARLIDILGVRTGPTYTILAELTDGGYVEFKLRTEMTLEELEARRGIPPREYKLTNRGTGKKIANSKRCPDGTILVPALQQ
jgi:hypothetical protein